MDLIVLAKEPIPGRVKTRLCPPLDPVEAADLAAAAIADTLEAACASGADRVLLALDGSPGPWIPEGVVVVDQGEGGLDRRLARSWSHAAGPFVQIGMDTPQVTASALDGAMDPLRRDGGPSSVLGPASDGGWWALGLRRADPALVLGVPTSRPDTGRLQLDRLVDAGLAPWLLDEVTDVDTIADARAVAAAAPTTRFARHLSTLAVAP